MILQFPTPYPGELLYSTLGRYHLRSGNVFWKHTIEDLFGNKTLSATAILPSGIRSLVERLPQNTTIGEKALIYKHTLFPFHTAFLPREKALSIYDAMLSNDGMKIYMQSGIMASSIPQNKFFKYCPACLNADTFGEMYWKREHQLPGKLICLIHGLWLEDSSVPITQSNKHTYVMPSDANCDLKKENQVDEVSLKFHLNFLLQAERLLNSEFSYISFEHYTDFYRKHLIQKGFASNNGRVNQVWLQEAFRSYYPDEFLADLNIDPNSVELWLASITRKHRKSFHPYYHILLLNFLGLHINDVFGETASALNQANHDSWPCLNIVCPDYRRNVINEVSVRTCERTKKPIRRFTCQTCGLSYTRKGIDVQMDDRYKYSRIMDYGSLWKKELQTLSDQKLSHREIAQRLRVTVDTVIKYERILNEPKIEQRNEPLEEDKETVEFHKQTWLRLQQQNTQLTKTQLRKQASSTYIFLYRHDRGWLDKNSPVPYKRRTTNNRVNWQERDEEILQKVEQATTELRNMKGKLKRITRKSLGDFIGERALIEKHLNKMPKTEAYIEEVKESEQEFRVRRVMKVITEMKEAGEIILSWKVLRTANIKSQFAKEITYLIKENQM
jgi:transcriptional regulator with XRE-family HTH domain